MEAENDEATKGHDNTFSLHSILFIVQVSAGLAFAGYCGYPAIVNVLEGFILWFDWFRLVLRNLFFIFIILNALIGSIYFTFLKATEKKKPSLRDEYITAVPSDVRSSPEQSFSPMEVGHYNNSCYQESVQPFQAVNTVEESSRYERVVMETNSKSYKRMISSEKKMKKTRSSTVECHQRMESERVMKTASCRSSRDMMDELSSEEFRMKIETFIMETKMMYHWQNGVVDHRQKGGPQLQNGGVHQCQNGVPQLQNGVPYHWKYGFPQFQNGGVHQWQNCFPQLQNGGVHQWQNGYPQLQGQPDYDGTGRRLVGGSGSTSSHGPHLAILD
ncbi:unnamed protein product [Brassica oleracea]